MHNNGPVLFVSPDDDEVDLNYRLLAAEATVPLNHLRTGAMSDADFEKLHSRFAAINAAPLVRTRRRP